MCFRCVIWRRFQILWLCILWKQMNEYEALAEKYRQSKIGVFGAKWSQRQSVLHKFHAKMSGTLLESSQREAGDSILHVALPTTGQWPFTTRFLHRVRSSASSLDFRYPLLSFRPSSSSLLLLPRLPVNSMCFRRQFASKMWTTQLTFVLFTPCTIFLYSLTLCISSFFTRLVLLIFSILLQQHTSELPRYFWSTFRNVQFSALKRCSPNVTLY